MAIEWWVADEKSQNQKLSEKKHLWGHTLELLPKTPRCQLEGLRWDFPTQHKWYMSSLWCQVVTGRKFWLIQARSKLYGVFFLIPISAETFFTTKWNTRPSSEKPWHWIPCRLVHGAKVHDLMPLQTNLYFLRGKNLTTKISAYFAKRCCLNKIHGEKNKHKMWYLQHIPSPKKQ